MAYVIAAPEMMTAAASDLAAIGSNVDAAHNRGAGQPGLRTRSPVERSASGGPRSARDAIPSMSPRRSAHTAPSDKLHDVDLQRRLWEVSEELTGVVYPVG
jgi:hypothetical protein